eukprot:SAG31_NODE_11518_length_1021_cov_2.732104_1_plen_83_part_00
MWLAAESAFPAMHGRFILKNASAITVLIISSCLHPASRAAAGACVEITDDDTNRYDFEYLGIRVPTGRILAMPTGTRVPSLF